MKTNTHLVSYFAQFFLEWEMFQTKAVELIKTHILRSVTFFLIENRAVCEKLWENIAEPDKQQMRTWRMRTVCWIPTATDTHPKYIKTYCSFTATMITQTRVSVRLATHL
jgi:hypothetical protein